MPSLPLSHSLTRRSPQSDLNNNLSSGAIAGIVIGVVIFLILAILGIVYLSRHQSAKRHEESLRIQRERNANRTVRDRAGTLIHGEGDAGAHANGVRPKIGGMRIGESYYHETGSAEMEKRV